MAYSPANSAPSSLASINVIYNERKAVENLKATTPFLGMTKMKPLPVNSGTQIKFYSYALLGANTTAVTEGTVGSPVTESQTSTTATIGQYADFISAADLSMEAAIDDPQLLENLSGELSYRLGLTLNSLVRITADTASGVDSAAKITLAEDSELTAANIRTAAQSLVGVNARPLFSDGYFGGVIHPFVVQDVLNDTTANGLTDILKRSESGAQKLMALPQNDAVIEFAGVKFKQSTTCPTSTINTKTFYNTYIFADDAIFSVFLGKSPDGQKNFNLKINVAPENGSVADPARVIGGWVAYNVN